MIGWELFSRSNHSDNMISLLVSVTKTIPNPGTMSIPEPQPEEVSSIS